MKKQRKKRRAFKSFVLVLLGICLIALAALLVLSLSVTMQTKGRIVSADTADACFENADVIFVLGCGVKQDGTPSDMLRDRLDTALALYENGVASKILVSGDHGSESYDEPNAMKDYLVENGVAPSDVFMDHAGFSTYESMYRAKAVFGIETMIVVTQKYHLYRALYDADCFEIDAYGVAADLHEYRGQIMREIREIAARIKDALYCRIKPLPTYLGESIDVSGDGNITNG